MSERSPSEFYTDLVADLYRPLKSSSYPADPYREMIRRLGEPALELGCGDGDPLLDLVASGLDVDGIDSSPDMIERLRRRAAERNLTVHAWVADMRTLSLPRRYATVFLAGPTFNLLPDDEAMAEALTGIASGLADGGTAVVPLFVPEPIGPDGLDIPTRASTPMGSISWRIVTAARDEDARTQTLRLRYQRDESGATETLEREWITHWIGLARFTELAGAAGLTASCAADEIGSEPEDVVLRAR